MRRAAPAVLALSLSAAGLVAAAPAHAKAPNLIAHYSVQSVTCVPAAGGTVRARVRVRMVVVNYHGLRGLDWAQHMTVKARLIPTTAGLNISRAWRQWKTPYLTQDKRHAYDITVTTDTVSPAADWKVQLKMVWDRSAPAPDVVKETTRPFTGSCGGAGTSLGPAPAVPSSNAG